MAESNDKTPPTPPNNNQPSNQAQHQQVNQLIPVRMEPLNKDVGTNRPTPDGQSLPAKMEMMLDHQIPGGHPLNENKGNDLKK